MTLDEMADELREILAELCYHAAPRDAIARLVPRLAAVHDALLQEADKRVL